jgi:putative DeoR family transcriptional regulator (stage III sporulation protein D)
LKDYIEERAISIANFIVDNNATVRQTAKEFGVSKSTVHAV